VECELEAIYDAGDHELVVGLVLDLGVGPASRFSSTGAASGTSSPEGK